MAAAQHTDRHVRDARVRTVLGWMLAGRRTTAIYALVERQFARELAARKKAERERAAARAADTPADEWPELPAVLWSQHPKPPSERAIDDYIKRARELMRAEASELPKQAVAMMGIWMGQWNDTFHRAIKSGDVAAQARLLQIKADVFGYSGAVRVQLDDPGASPSGIPTKDAPETPLTAETAASEINRLAARAVTLARARRLATEADARVGSQN